MSDLISRPYRPDPTQCCSACVFQSGAHADWCPQITGCEIPHAEFVRRCLNGPDDFRRDVEIVIREGRK